MTELGNKHECLGCGTKFYDLGKSELVCPKCGENQKDLAETQQGAGGKDGQKKKKKSSAKAKKKKKSAEPAEPEPEAADEEAGAAAEKGSGETDEEDLGEETGDDEE